VTIPIAYNTPNIDLVDWNNGNLQSPINKKIPIIQALKLMYDNIMNNNGINLYLHRDWCTSDDLDSYIKNWDINTDMLIQLDANFVSGSSPSQYKKKVFFFMQI
jgi:hypothetical protein